MAAGVFSRMGYRERRTLAMVMGISLLVLVFGLWLYLEQRIESLNEDYDEGQETLEQLRAEARNYLLSIQKKTALEEIVQKNDPKIQTAIDSIARKVNVRLMKTEGGEERISLDKVLRYDAKTNRRTVTFGDSKDEGERKKKIRGPQVVELTQPIEFAFVDFAGLLEFLDAVENQERLMYVSSLEVNLKFGSEDFVRGKTSVSTFIYEGAKQEEGE